MDIFQKNENEVFLQENEKKLAYCHFERKNGYLVIDKTFVDESLRGRKIAQRMIEEIKSIAKKEHLDLKATCSYAVSYLEKNPLV